MDPNLTGRGRPPSEVPPRGPSEPGSRTSGSPRMGRRGAAAIGALAIVTLLVATAGAGWLGLAAAPASSRRRNWPIWAVNGQAEITNGFFSFKPR